MSTADRRGREKEQRRNDIIDAAEKLFFSRGYENVTMDDVAKEVELARGTLYLYFKNKDDIYLAIATRGAKIFNHMLSDCCQGEQTGFEKAKSLFSTFYEFYKSYPGYYLANWHSQMPRYNEADLSAMDELKRIRSDNFRIVAAAISEGIQDGTVRDDLDPTKTTLFWMSSLQGVFNITPAVEMHMQINRVGHDELIEYVMRLILRSVEKPVGCSA